MEKGQVAQTAGTAQARPVPHISLAIRNSNTDADANISTLNIRYIEISARPTNSAVFFNPIMINECPGGRVLAKFPELSIHPLPARKFSGTLLQSPQGFSKKLDGATNRTIEQTLTTPINTITICQDFTRKRSGSKRGVTGKSASL